MLMLISFKLQFRKNTHFYINSILPILNLLGGNVLSWTTKFLAQSIGFA